MLGMLNFKAIGKAIKSEKKGKIIWQVRNGEHFVANGHWGLKLPTMNTDILIPLVQLMQGQQPNEGETLVFNAGHINKQSLDVHQILWANIPNMHEGKVTSFSLNLEKSTARLLKFPDHIVALDEKYFSFVEGEKECFTRGKNDPVYFCNNFLVILQIRLPNLNEYLNEIA
jgi:hypothetical protein